MGDIKSPLGSVTFTTNPGIFVPIREYCTPASHSCVRQICGLSRAVQAPAFWVGTAKEQKLQTICKRAADRKPISRTIIDIIGKNGRSERI
ncbi:hypothetical protein [Bradyrhizobium sp. CCH5-F6]|uniref:hypothetical protein n=1 Tax=Bradyrhizobium sp. CCH5-F6 TaxID=1768753 RepID=UPI0012E3E2E9|nr:hypothetical protein [Bradyrhizobium sp. CCH5-F6]